jgi:hypothetical protein
MYYALCVGFLVDVVIGYMVVPYICTLVVDELPFYD